MNASISFLPRLLAGLLLTAGVLVAPVQATPASTVDSPPSLIEHLRTELESDDTMRRQYALLDVINLASCPNTCTVALRSFDEKRIRIENETGMGAIDLNALVPELLEAYRSGPADGHRLLALSALINVGNEEAIDQLVDEGAAQSESVNRATQWSLAAFYLEKYPELTERTLRTKKLSLEDVARARALRVKQAKKK